MIVETVLIALAVVFLTVFFIVINHLSNFFHLRG
jgi:hypothetical protein